MTPLAHYRMFGHYNAWANSRLYDAAARLSPDQYRADRGAFFKSVHGTLNHLLATDRIWMQRFTGAGDAPDRLDAILFEQLDPLREAREAEDARIVRYVTGLDAVYQVVEHFGLHYGQIIVLTKILAAQDMGFYKELSQSGRASGGAV